MRTDTGRVRNTKQFGECTTRASTNIDQRCRSPMAMIRTSRHIDIERMADGEPRPMYINHFDIVGHHRGWFGIGIEIFWIDGRRTRMFLEPIGGFARDTAFIENEHRIVASDITRPGACNCKRCLRKVAHIIGDEYFVQFPVGLCEQNGCAAYANTIGVAANPIRRITRREQKFGSGRPAECDTFDTCECNECDCEQQCNTSLPPALVVPYQTVPTPAQRAHVRLRQVVRLRLRLYNTHIRRAPILLLPGRDGAPP